MRIISDDRDDRVIHFSALLAGNVLKHSKLLGHIFLGPIAQSFGMDIVPNIFFDWAAVLRHEADERQVPEDAS